MKRIFVAFAISVIAITLHAQEALNPAIKKGVKFHYTVNTGDGQELPLLISIDSITSKYVKLGWNIEGMGAGGWVMKQNSLDNANRGWWGEPIAGSDVDIADEQTVLLLSKAQWKAIMGNKKMEYDQQPYTVKQPTELQQLKLNGRILNVIMLEGQNGTSRVWVLNNPDFPAVVKIEGNPMGIDLWLTAID
jgi:hypothetical protein